MSFFIPRPTSSRGAKSRKRPYEHGYDPYFHQNCPPLGQNRNTQFQIQTTKRKSVLRLDLKIMVLPKHEKMSGARKKCVKDDGRDLILNLKAFVQSARNVKRDDLSRKKIETVL
jgi:hypothetical protein